MGIRIFYDGEQIDAVMPKIYQSGHTEMDYVFEMSGNHIFRVDLYDISQDGRVLTYTFNIGAQNTFGEPLQKAIFQYQNVWIPTRHAAMCLLLMLLMLSELQQILLPMFQ